MYVYIHIYYQRLLTCRKAKLGKLLKYFSKLNLIREFLSRFVVHCTKIFLLLKYYIFFLLYIKNDLIENTLQMLCKYRNFYNITQRNGIPRIIVAFVK